MEHVEDFGVGIVFFEEGADEIGGIDGEVEGAEIFTEGEVAFLEFPVGEVSELAGGIGGEYGVAEVEEIDAAVESAGARFGFAMSAFCDGADDAVVSGDEGEDLRGFAVFGLAEADGGGGDEGHWGIIVRGKGKQM